MRALTQPQAEAVAVMLTRTDLEPIIDVDAVLTPTGLLDDVELRDIVSSWKATCTAGERALLDVLIHVALGTTLHPDVLDVLDNNNRQAATLAIAIREQE